MSYDLSGTLNSLFSEYSANPRAYADFNSFLDRVGQEYRNSTSSSREADIAVEKILSAAKKAGKELAAWERGDVVNISEAAKSIFEQYKNEATPSSREMPHATMQAMTAQGTEVTVTAKSFQVRPIIFGGAEGKSLTASKGITALTVGGEKPGDDIEMQYTVSFKRQNGHAQTFDISENTIFQENKDGMIMAVSAGEAGSLTGSVDQDIMVNITDDTAMHGGGGDDIMFNLGKNSTMEGGEGDDVMLSMGDNARIRGGEGDDAIAILQDTLRARFDEAEADSQKETDEKNTYARPQFSQTVDIDAGNGDDSIVLSPTMYKSSISGGDGMDDIYANDMIHSTLDAGEGSDTVRLATATKSEILLGAGSDILTADDLLKSSVNAGDGHDTVNATNSHMSNIAGGDGDDVIMLDDASKSNIDGGSGNDYLYVQSGSDTFISGGMGDDFIRSGGMANSSASGSDGNDTIIINAASNSAIQGGEGNDRIWLENSHGNNISGGDGNDEIWINKDKESVINGDAGDDDILVGSIGKDATDKTIIDGGFGNNSVNVDVGELAIFRKPLDMLV